MSKEQYEKCKGTMFKKGNVPANHMKVGEYTHTTDGYLIRKVKEKGSQRERFEFVHRATWEKYNGPIPKGKRLYFLIITRTIAIYPIWHLLMVRNFCNYQEKDSDLTRQN